MAARHSYYHNPNLGSEVTGWSALAENVGKGSDAASLHQAFMGSSGHRANILSTTYTEVGVGTATDSGGTLYVVQIFRRPSGTTYRAPQRTTATRTTATTRTRTPSRASRSTRRAAPVVRRPAISPTVALRSRLRVVSAWSFRRANTRAFIPRMLIFHETVTYLAPR